MEILGVSDFNLTPDISSLSSFPCPLCLPPGLTGTEAVLSGEVIWGHQVGMGALGGGWVMREVIVGGWSLVSEWVREFLPHP